MSGDAATDAELMSAVADGREAAFVELYRRRRADVFRFAYALSRSRAIAQDVTQEVFVALLENAVRYDPAKGSVRAWLLGSARHSTVTRLRADGRLCRDEHPPVDVASPCPGEEAVFAAQRLARLHAAIMTLPLEYREALVLCELQELSYADCAAVLRCPVGTVRSRLHRARLKLAAALGMEAPEPKAEPLLKTSEVC